MLKIFISYFIKGSATTILIVGSMVNLLNNGTIGIVAALMNTLILTAVWCPDYISRESE